MMFVRFKNRKFDPLDSENAQFRPENRILRVKLCIYIYIYTAGNVIIPPTEWLLEEIYCLTCVFLNRIMGLYSTVVPLRLALESS